MMVFLFLLMDFKYSLELTRCSLGLKFGEHHNLCFRAKIRKQFLSEKSSISTSVKIHSTCILHRYINVMNHLSSYLCHKEL